MVLTNSLRLQISSISIGQAYELFVLRVLQGYSFRLQHTGRSGDKGQDFIGEWVLPGARVPVVGQCKNHKNPLNPGSVREFEGVLLRKANKMPVNVGILVSNSGFSTKAVETSVSSEMPIILCTIKTAIYPQSPVGVSRQDELTLAIDEASHSPSHVSANAGHLEQFSLNLKAQRILPNVSIAWQHGPVGDADGGHRRVVLLCKDLRDQKLYCVGRGKTYVI